MRIWWAALPLLMATPAVAADQFDLVCTAKKTVVRYRVDLATGEYCDGNCTETRKIAAISSATLTLFDRRPAYRGDWEGKTEVNRTTGSWSVNSYSPKTQPFPFQQNGLCEPADFSGFPQHKF